MTNTNLYKIKNIALHSVRNKLNEKNIRLAKDFLGECSSF